MKKYQTFSAMTITGLICGSVQATNGDQMIGLSASQVGMGGVSAAHAQDALVMLSNPAGIGNLGMQNLRLDLGFGLLNPPREVNGQSSDSNLYMMPAGGAAFKINDKLTFGVAMGGVSGMGVDINDINPTTPGNQQMVTTKQVFKFSPGFAYQINPNLSLGASLNIIYQSLAVNNTALNLPQNQTYGLGTTLGATYRINDALSIGGAWTSRTNMASHQYNTGTGRFELTMDGPQSLLIGLAYKPNSSTTIGFDVKQIMYSEVMKSIGLKTPSGSINQLNYGWSDQTVYMLGIAKTMENGTTLRAGFNYGASPINSEDVATNLGSTAVVEKHITIGISKPLTNNLAGNVSYAHAFENSVAAVNGSSLKMSQHQVNLNLSYQF